jgi:hypothetical protein
MAIESYLNHSTNPVGCAAPAKRSLYIHLHSCGDSRPRLSTSRSEAVVDRTLNLMDGLFQDRPTRIILSLEVKPKLRRKCPRRHVVCAAERGKKVIQRILVGQINDGQLRAHPESIAVKVK